MTYNRAALLFIMPLSLLGARIHMASVSKSADKNPQGAPQVWTQRCVARGWNRFKCDHSYCEKDGRKDLADVKNEEECFALAEQDAECGNIVSTNGQLCRCMLVGKECVEKDSQTDSHIYDGTPKDIRALTIAGAGDGGANGELKVIGIADGRPEYELVDNKRMEVRWRASKNQWQVVYDRVAGSDRVIYYNWQNTDLAPLTGWQTDDDDEVPAPNLIETGSEPAAPTKSESSYFKPGGPQAWKVADKHAYCSNELRKDLADVSSESECAALVDKDPDCGKYMYTNGELCRCVKAGEKCDFKKSDNGNHVWQVEGMKDVRDITIENSGDARVNGKLVVKEYHRGRPKYTLEGNDKMEVFWSNSEKRWRIVFENKVGVNRANVYTNWENSDFVPLSGWQTDDKDNLPVPSFVAA